MDNIKDISKQPLIEWGGQAVITTAQLAQAYGTTTKNVSNNFNRNESRFEIGKHYFVLQGAELKDFMRVSSERGQVLSPSTSIVYLWTRRGASRHCKILGTDKAWEQFDYLEDNYFDRKEQKQATPLTLQQQIQTIAKGTDELYERVDKVTADVDGVKSEIETIKNDLPILPLEADNIVKAVKRRGVAVLGGKESPAYNNRGLRQKLYNDLYGDLKHNFDVRSYKAIRRKDAEKAVQIVNEYKPPLFLADQIEQENAQMHMNDIR